MGLTFFRREENRGDVDILRLLRWRRRDHVHIVTIGAGNSRDTFLAVASPVLFAQGLSDIYLWQWIRENIHCEDVLESNTTRSDSGYTTWM